MFREQIRKHYDHLSRSYRRVADFILSDYRTAAFMTAAALADAVDVDTTTVVRFAQRLGYPGFPELIEDIQEQVKLELSQTYATPSEEEGVHSKVQMLVAKDRTNLEKALAHNTLETIENILDMLRAAPRIVVTGESYAEPIAESFAHMLRDAGLPVMYAGGDVYERAICAGAPGAQGSHRRHDPRRGAFRGGQGPALCPPAGRPDPGVHAEPQQPGGARLPSTCCTRPAKPKERCSASPGSTPSAWPLPRPSPCCSLKRLSSGLRPLRVRLRIWRRFALCSLLWPPGRPEQSIGYGRALLRSPP